MRSFLAVAVGMVTLLAACRDGSTSRVVGRSAPTAILVTPPGTQAGDVSIVYTLTDAEGDLVSIVVEVSSDGGVVFVPATDAGPFAGSEGVAGLTSSPAGVQHVFVWDSRAEFPGGSCPTYGSRSPPAMPPPGHPG